VRTLLKRILTVTPGIYDRCKWLETRARYAFGVPYEREFEIFRTLPAHGLFADIGANIGQSALSFAAVRPGWDIISFEPNPALAGYLDHTSKVLGRRHCYRMIGLGEMTGRLTFHRPVWRGVEATQEGTFKPGILSEPATVARLGSGYELRSIAVPVEPFDRFDLRPDVVKIDVQGFEYEVLQGMRETLRARPPQMLYIEQGNETGRVAEFLGGFGYSAWKVAGRRLEPWNNDDCVNVIFRR
jgi:FkbM family methyltransferase